MPVALHRRGCGWMTAHEVRLESDDVPLCRRWGCDLTTMPEPCRDGVNRGALMPPRPIGSLGRGRRIYGSSSALLPTAPAGSLCAVRHVPLHPRSHPPLHHAALRPACRCDQMMALAPATLQALMATNLRYVHEEWSKANL